MSLVQWEFHWMTGRKLVRWGSIPFRGWASSVGDSRWERRRGSRLELRSRRSCIRILFVAWVSVFFFSSIGIAVCIVVVVDRDRHTRAKHSSRTNHPLYHLLHSRLVKNVMSSSTICSCPIHTHRIEAEYHALVPSAFQLTECLIPFNMAWSILSKTSLVTP